MEVKADRTERKRMLRICLVFGSNINIFASILLFGQNIRVPTYESFRENVFSVNLYY